MWHMLLSSAVIAVALQQGVSAFSPTASRIQSPPTTLNMMDPALMIDAATTTAANSGIMADPATTAAAVDNSWLMAFTDQGQNLAGIFFQASLLPYLLFLYFLSFRANQVPALGNFGFQFVLLFVISTIPSGIISKSVYGFSLADTDYLHGSAEMLLTVANVLIVLGFKEAMTKEEPAPIGKARTIAFGLFGAFAALCATGPKIFADGHTPFLFGLGGFPRDAVTRFPFVNHVEPINALSIPTWAIHFSSVFEYVFAMGLIWEFAKTVGNERWKGLTWGMLPLHASGICACTYHFFYNPPELQFLVTSQAGLTLLGNITLMIAAFRIAQSNGWTVQELVPSFGTNEETSPYGLVADGLANKPLVLKEESESTTELALSLVAATIFTSYFVKYGELAIDLPFTPNPVAALAMILGIPALTGYYFYNKSQEAGEWKNPTEYLPKFSMPGQQEGEDGEGSSSPLSMADIKKYGVAGTLAYVLTELAFWLVAFPVAAVALYKSTGHWPDVINDTTDRAAVLAFIFAGANIARAFVPVRLGAALALAPWVDDNILSRMSQSADEESESMDSKEISTTATLEVPAKTIPTPPPSAPKVVADEKPKENESTPVAAKEETAKKDTPSPMDSFMSNFQSTNWGPGPASGKVEEPKVAMDADASSTQQQTQQAEEDKIVAETVLEAVKEQKEDVGAAVVAEAQEEQPAKEEKEEPITAVQEDAVVSAAVPNGEQRDDAPQSESDKVPFFASEQ